MTTKNLRRPASVLLGLGIVLTLLAIAPAAAQTASSARATAFGVRVLGIVPPTPEVAAEIPPGATAEESETLIEIPADPLLVSATASATAVVSEAPDIEAALQAIASGVNAALPTGWNASGFAITEALSALDGVITADLIAAEALASCVGDQTVFATASQFQNVAIADNQVPLDELGDALAGGLAPLIEAFEPLLGESSLQLFVDQPNDVVLEVPPLGLRIIAWETNWDGGTGTTDGSDTVWVNALRISFTEPLSDLLQPLLGEPTDIVISRAEATADCAAPPVPPPPGPVPPPAEPPPAPLPRTGAALVVGAGLLLAGTAAGATRFLRNR